MKRILALVVVALLCTACAGGTAPSSSASGITMYGTIDQGITIHN
ncbi:hypothetical protein PWR63_11415 [Paraburkholderia sp. A2WS-5]